jgi:DNA-binding MarR family transcriptional regulator/N-acetylglutamate synthase-like GNAT family acetyltransferase
MAGVADASLTDQVAGFRDFNRFFTNEIGLLRRGLLDTPYSLTEARVLYELGQAEVTETKSLRERIDVDRGYLSRILARFEEGGYVKRGRSEADARVQTLRLTAKGRMLVAGLERRSSEDAGARLEPLAEPDRTRLLAAMGTIRAVLDPAARAGGFELREPRVGELGWVVSRHGEVYSGSYGWDVSFEALVAAVVGEFAAAHDPERERAWIAEVGGRPAGSIFCVADDEATARLRLLLVEPWARGLGLGATLVDACVEFARAAGYRRLVLWTHESLTAARRLYAAAGFRLVTAEPEVAFGHANVAEDWELEL